MPDLSIELEVNGRPVKKQISPSLRLLDFLRDELDLTGTKEGCGAGECGTCSVFVDGKLMKSCLVPVAKAHGSSVETIEALAGTGDLTPVQKAFHKTGASQCGYCIPGMVMASAPASGPDVRTGMISTAPGISRSGLFVDWSRISLAWPAVAADITSSAATTALMACILSSFGKDVGRWPRS